MGIIKNLALFSFLLIFISCASNNENEEVIYLKNWEIKSTQLIKENGKELTQSANSDKDFKWINKKQGISRSANRYE